MFNANGVVNLIRQRVLRRHSMIWVYSVRQCPFYKALGIKGLNIVIQTVYERASKNLVWSIKHYLEITLI